MMRTYFDEQLRQLKEQMTAIASASERCIYQATEDLFTGHPAEIRDLHGELEEIIRMEREIENLCMHLLLQQQPVARDLRRISAALKMVTDLKRIGDQAADIVEILHLGHALQPENELPFHEIADDVRFMVTEAINAYVKTDIQAAEKVIAHDYLADAAFNNIKARLIDGLRDPDADGERAIDLLMIAKYYEKIGDHAERMARWVIFSATGNYPEEK